MNVNILLLKKIICDIIFLNVIVGVKMNDKIMFFCN